MELLGLTQTSSKAPYGRQERKGNHQAWKSEWEQSFNVQATSKAPDETAARCLILMTDPALLALRALLAPRQAIKGGYKLTTGSLPILKGGRSIKH